MNWKKPQAEKNGEQRRDGWKRGEREKRVIWGEEREREERETRNSCAPSGFSSDRLVVIM